MTLFFPYAAYCSTLYYSIRMPACFIARLPLLPLLLFHCTYILPPFLYTRSLDRLSFPSGMVDFVESLRNCPPSLPSGRGGGLFCVIFFFSGLGCWGHGSLCYAVHVSSTACMRTQGDNKRKARLDEGMGDDVE